MRDPGELRAVSFAERAKEKEEKLTRTLVNLLEKSGLDVERVSIDENNRGPDVVARGENGRMVIEVKALERGGSIHPALEQVRGYGKPGDELFVVTTTDEVPWFLPEDVHVVTGSQLLGKLKESGVDRGPVEWVRETNIERDPPRFRAESAVEPGDGEGGGGFLKGSELERVERGEPSALEYDELACRILEVLEEPRTVLDAAERLAEEPTLVESKIRFLCEVGAVERETAAGD